MSNKYYKSIAAGLFIGLGAWIYLMCPDRTIGALLFSCGLLGIRIYNLNLYTGKIQYAIKKNEYKWYDYFIFLVGNLIGIILMTLFTKFTLPVDAMTLGEAKAHMPFLISLIRGVGCGALMSLATNKRTPFWITSLCIATFILAGFNHCIADAYYILVSGNLLGISWVGTLLGNTIGGIIFSEILSEA